jgi:hypothetical protein
MNRVIGAVVVAAGLVILATARQHARRERDAFDALDQAGLWASNEAARRYPASAFSATDQKQNKWILEARRVYALDRKRAARAAIALDFGLTIPELDAIERRGQERGRRPSDRSPLFDPSKVKGSERLER